jgi:hypothetical protein
MEKVTIKLPNNAGESSPCLNSVECSSSIVLPTYKRLVKSKEALSLLGGVSRGTLRRWELAGMIYPVRFNSKFLLWKVSDIEKLTEAYSVRNEGRAA